MQSIHMPFLFTSFDFTFLDYNALNPCGYQEIMKIQITLFTVNKFKEVLEKSCRL